MLFFVILDVGANHRNIDVQSLLFVETFCFLHTILEDRND